MAGIKRFLKMYEIQIQCRLPFVNLFSDITRYENLFLCPFYNLLTSFLNQQSILHFIVSIRTLFAIHFFCLLSYFSSPPYPFRYILFLVVYSLFLNLCSGVSNQFTLSDLPGAGFLADSQSSLHPFYS